MPEESVTVEPKAAIAVNCYDPPSGEARMQVQEGSFCTADNESMGPMRRPVLHPVPAILGGGEGVDRQGDEDVRQS